MRFERLYTLVLLIGFCFFQSNLQAVPKVEILKKQELSERKHQKLERKLNRIIKKMAKKGIVFEKPIVEEDLSFADDRFRYGLFGILGGILLTIILIPSLKFLGAISVFAGIALVIWAILD